MSLCVPTRRELRRAFSFSHGAGDGDVAHLAAIDSATEKQSTAAHIAAADEIGGETETLAEMFEKNVDVFGRGDTAEQNDLAVERQFFRETLHVPLQRPAVTRIVFAHVYFGKLAEIGEADRRGCWD